MFLDCESRYFQPNGCTYVKYTNDDQLIFLLNGKGFAMRCYRCTINSSGLFHKTFFYVMYCQMAVTCKFSQFICKFKVKNWP